MKRVVTKIGHIFCAEIDGEYKCFLQFVAVDETQLNSTVIRVFKTHYPMDYKPNLDEIVKDDVDFYAHVMLNNGVREGIWYRVGKHQDLGDTENIMFRQYNDSEDYYDEHGIPQIRKTSAWWIWKINQDFIDIGAELPNEYRSLPEGSVFPYTYIIRKIKTGHFNPLGSGSYKIMGD